MAFPSGAQTITVTGMLPNPVGGGPRKGRVVFTPSARLVDSTQQAIYSGGGEAVLDNTGKFSIVLLCNDDTDVQPAGWRWRVDEQPSGGTRATYWIDLPHTLGPTVDLSEVAVVTAPDGSSGSGSTTTRPTGPAGGALSGTYPNPGLSTATIAAFDAAGAASAAQTAAAADATAKVAAHAAATDPHGDRAAATAALAAHAADTSDVHGIPDTTTLETQTGAQEKATAAQTAATTAAASDATSKVTAHTGASDPHGDRAAATTALSAHSASTTNVHGIPDTAALETGSGAQAKADAAQTAATSTAAADATSKIGAHTAAADPHGDRAYTDSAIAGRVPSSRQITAGTGLTGGGTLSADRSLAVNFGTSAGTAAAGNDSRLTDPRTPTAHAGTHAAAGSDPVTPAAIGALAATGDQSFTGELTFLDRIPVVPAFDAAFANQLVRLAQVEALIAAALDGAGGGSAFRTAKVRITDDNLSGLPGAASWAIVPTSAGTLLKCSISAAVGDRVTVVGRYMRKGGHFLDWVLLDSAGNIAVYAGTETSSPLSEGDPALYPSLSFGYEPGPPMFEVGAGHIDGAGKVTVALAHQGSAGGNANIVYAHSTYPFRMRLENHGPEPA